MHVYHWLFALLLLMSITFGSNEKETLIYPYIWSHENIDQLARDDSDTLYSVIEDSPHLHIKSSKDTEWSEWKPWWKGSWTVNFVCSLKSGEVAVGWKEITQNKPKKYNFTSNFFKVTLHRNSEGKEFTEFALTTPSMEKPLKKPYCDRRGNIWIFSDL